MRIKIITLLYSLFLLFGGAAISEEVMAVLPATEEEAADKELVPDDKAECKCPNIMTPKIWTTLLRRVLTVI